VFEFTVVDLEEISIIFSGGHGIDTKDASCLRQRFDLQNAGHDGVAGEVADKKLNVTFLIPTICRSVSSMILSTSRKGKRWGRVFSICWVVKTGG